MGRTKGSLLITATGMEIGDVAPEQRDKAILAFFEMKTEAERQNDRFYALQEFFSHEFSFGHFYDLLNDWKTFQNKGILHSISQSTFQYLQSFCQCPLLTTLENDMFFLQKEEPRGHSGVNNSHGDLSFINDLTSWEQWHRKWNTEHPEDIDWSKSENDWFPRPDLIIQIMHRELQAHCDLEAEGHHNQDVVSMFYSLVMRRKGPSIHAYAQTIGSEICKCNYYREEVELSAMEQRVAGSLRKIYSIYNRHGFQQFISIDFAHGMFEFHDENGSHQGEYRFDGSPNAESQTNHSFKCMEKWKRKMR